MQDFATLKSDLIFNGEIFEDIDFPCDRDTLFYTRDEERDKELEKVVWKRPKVRFPNIHLDLIPSEGKGRVTQ